MASPYFPISQYISSRSIFGVKQVTLHDVKLTAVSSRSHKLSSDVSPQSRRKVVMTEGLVTCSSTQGSWLHLLTSHVLVGFDRERLCCWASCCSPNALKLLPNFQY